MILRKDGYYSNATTAIIFLMGGVPPTTAEEVKARFNIRSLQDLYDKSLGVTGAVLGTMPAAPAEDPYRNQCSQKFLGNHLMTGLRGGRVPMAGFSATPVQPTLMPDRVFPCNLTTFARPPAMGIHDLNVLRILPWMYPASSPSHSALWCDAIDYEWDEAQTFKGAYLRIGSAAYNSGELQYFDEATSAWKVALPMSTFNSNAATSNTEGCYKEFSAPITAKKVRCRVPPPSSSAMSHTMIPVLAEAPAPKPVGDCTWAVWVQCPNGYGLTSQVVSVLGNDCPLPFHVMTVGGPESSAGKDLVLSKNIGIMSNDNITITGVVLRQSNLESV